MSTLFPVQAFAEAPLFLVCPQKTHCSRPLQLFIRSIHMQHVFNMFLKTCHIHKSLNPHLNLKTLIEYEHLLNCKIACNLS